MANTLATLDYEDIRATLTPDQWYGIITADEEGLLPICCGEISAVREEMAHFLGFPNAVSAAGVAEAILDNGCGVAPELVAFAGLLVAKLETRDGNWREFNKRDDDAMEYFNACLTFARGSVAGSQPSGDNWHGEFNATLAMLTEPITVDQIIAFREAGKVALAAGAPPAALLALDACALALYRGSARPAAGNGDGGASAGGGDAPAES